MVTTRSSSRSALYLGESAPPKASTKRSSSSVANTSSSTSRIVKVAPPKKQRVSTSSTTSPKPSEIPVGLYALIQRAARCRKSLKFNPNNRLEITKLEDYERRILNLAMFYQYQDELPFSWKYNPETSFMAHVPKPPTPPKPKTNKKKIRITWRSPNYHGPYLLNNDEQKIWNKFKMNDTTEARTFVTHPIKTHLTLVNKDDMVAGILGKLAVDTFNKSCHMYVNKDEDNLVSGAAVVECKYYKLTSKYIFYMIIEALEQGKPGVYEARLQCAPDSGARTVCTFALTDREPGWERPRVQPRPESKSEAECDYETVEDGSSDPEDFYELTGLVHRRGSKGRGGFNYHNPATNARDRLVCSTSESRKFLPNVSRPLKATQTIPMDR